MFRDTIAFTTKLILGDFGSLDYTLQQGNNGED